MLQISESQKKKWIIGTAKKSVIISFPDVPLTLTNDDLVSESLNLTEQLESEKYLTFTGCIASRLKFKCRALAQDVRGQRINVSISIGTDAPLPLFTGYVSDQDNLSQRDVLTEVSAYDDLVTINDIDVKTWYDGLTFPMTVAAFRASFWTYLGYTEETTTLPNDSLSLTKTITDEVIPAGKIAKWLCQLNARYGRINRSGNFEYLKLTPITEGLYPAEDLYPADNLYPSEENFQSEFTNATYQKVTYEPYKTDVITGVYIWDMAGINQGQAGSAGNILNIADNPLAWGVNMTTAAANIYNEIQNVRYIPARVDLIGLPYMEVGDIVMIHTDENLIRTYMMQRVLKGIQALVDSLVSDCEKKLKPYKESVATAISSNDKSILKIQADIVQMNALIADRATIGELNAVSARVGTIEANYITASQVSATYATISSLNAVSAAVNSLSAKSITTDNLNAKLAEFYGTIGVHHVIGDSGSIILADRYEVYNGGRMYFYNSGGYLNNYLDFGRVGQLLNLIGS